MPTKFQLDETRLPKAWYNITADLPFDMAPTLHPDTLEPITADFFSSLLPPTLIEQENTKERWVEIPEPVRDVYRLWRPTPMYRAHRLERALDTPAHLYYKYEGVSPVGSHKINTAVAQAFYNKQAGTKALVTDSGAGQWGSALSMACSMFDIGLEVFMVKVSLAQKPYRRYVMQNFGAQVYGSPSTVTAYGREILAKNPESPGSLGIAISESLHRVADSKGAKKASIGSISKHVLLHQTVIGLEALEQMDMANEYPDVVIGCAGGGSNFAGFAYPFLQNNILRNKTTQGA